MEYLQVLKGQPFCPINPSEIRSTEQTGGIHRLSVQFVFLAHVYIPPVLSLRRGLKFRSIGESIRRSNSRVITAPDRV